MRSARLFAAVAFSPAEKKELYAVSQQLKTHCSAGRFPAETLLHVTLHFFGQTDLARLPAIEAAMEQAASAFAPFTMATGRAGTFGRKDGAVLWLGIREGANRLKALQEMLETALEAQGFPPEGREFKAHITVGRDVKFNGPAGDVDVPGVELQVSGITLLESTQASGRLEYVPVVVVPFGEPRI